ncbi:HET-domain-containing protein [Hypoxylon sp. FL1857]|nr:HET-domain-containing protein [Hypoxylon sp. FL1857]
MSTELPNAEANISLCPQCKVLFSREGFSQLLSTNSFRHSKLGTFPDRANCRFCSYLWNEDFIGDSSQVYTVRRLRDLIYPASGRVQSKRQHELSQSWVTITRPIRDQHFLGLDGTAISLEPLTIGHDSIQAKAVDRIFINVETNEGRTKWQSFRPLRLIAPRDSPVASFTNFRPVEWNGLTTEWANDIKALLEHCRTSHPQCQPSGPTLLPSRVLRISEKSEVFPQVQLLVASKGQMGEYAALSYCWGGPQPLELTKQNFSALQGGIDDVALPRAIKDAIRVTHSLGLRYLWVDALCIMQNDPEDKKREISQMCAIYQNSFVTIAAATSSSVHESFLSNASTFNRKHATCTVPMALDSEGSQDSKRLNPVIIAPVHAYKTSIFPLNKRGWTFQEALLPRRLLVFGDLEPFVRCRTKNVMKKSWSCIDYQTSAVHPRRIIDSVANKQALERGLIVDTKGGDLEHIWREIVEQYTLRVLGFYEDRPLAIGGVIDFLSNMFGDKCHFGVWESCPVVCLLWKTLPLEERINIRGLPTWSWMSLTGPVDLDSLVYFDKPEGLVDWDGEDSYARLRISCCILKGEEVYSGTGETGSEILIEAWSDFSEGEAEYISLPSEDSYFLILCRLTNGHSLALVASYEEGDAYHRSGLAELNVPDGWRAKPREQIILV